MSSLIANVIAAIITIPLLGYIVVFSISKRIMKNHRRAFHMAIDWSTVFLIFAVHHLIIVIWEQSFFWLLAILMIIVASIFVLLHWKMKNEILILPILKGFWRMNFLLFFVAYIFLITFGLIQRLSS
ncbi:DUF3397 domain-containing protein [Bacillus marasmi]|uniref:DUF3397 domain-containing protein n=1 Tax=Bacillus marasmi TaxID=1926279 RepID=UPI0011CB96D2|nr:DUF3397 domain-containing protein [Bacillus marasmi]